MWLGDSHNYCYTVIFPESNTFTRELMQPLTVIAHLMVKKINIFRCNLKTAIFKECGN